MNFLMGIGTWFGQNILTKPEFFVGLLVFVGYLFLGKKIYENIIICSIFNNFENRS